MTSINKIIEPTYSCGTLTFVTPGRQQSTPVVNLFHLHKPNWRGRIHRSVGQNINKFNMIHAAKLASYRERDRLITAYKKTGNPEQRRYTLKKFLTHKSI
jgi:hypothetical protein